MGQAKKLRSLEYQQNLLQKDINQSMNEVLDVVKKKKDRGTKNGKSEKR